MFSNGLPVILAAKRTPHGKMGGFFSRLTAIDLAGEVVKNSIEELGLGCESVKNIVMGCVLSAGLGQAPARQVAFKAGLLESTAALMMNKVCGSGMAALIYGCAQLCEEAHQVVVCGGMESMSGAPYLARARRRLQFGHDVFWDHILIDGLEDAYEAGASMGLFAEELALSENLSRDAQDHYAVESVKRTLNAFQKGFFKKEMAPVMCSKDIFDQDESLPNLKPEKIKTLKPAFKKNGTITAATASGLADGASTLLITTDVYAKKIKTKPKALIAGWAHFSGTPKRFTLAPVGAVERLLSKLGWRHQEVDLWEVNEAFAVVPMAFMNLLKIPFDKVNVYGGALSIGHPLGSSGARVLVTLLNALEERNLKRGIAAVCIGGGEGLAVAIERS